MKNLTGLDSQEQLFYIIAGEVSGDVLGAGLMQSLKKLTLGRAKFVGIGGEQMIAEGLNSLFPIEELSVMGIFEIIPKIPRLLRMIKEVVDDVFIKNPVALITIDAKGFSLRVSKRVYNRQRYNQKKIKLIHLVAPTVWAWRPGRAREVSKYLDHLLVLFPFESPYFTCHGLPTTFIGHPAVEKASGNGLQFRRLFGIPEAAIVISLLPGSRYGEIDRLMPIFKETVEQLKKYYPNLYTVISMVPVVEDYIKNITSKWTLEDLVLCSSKDKLNAFSASNVALAASGTVTLELVLARVPTVVAYKVHFLTALIGRFLVQRDAIVLPNKILEKPMLPFFMQGSCNSDALFNAVVDKVNNIMILEEMQLANDEIRERVRAPGGASSACAARTILNLLSSK
jgi:lipid-A-disaccharide synthase